MKAVQAGYDLRPLSTFHATWAPAVVAKPDWPVWDEHGFTKTTRFFELLDFLLQFAPPLPEDAAARAQLASLRPSIPSRSELDRGGRSR